MSAPVRYAVYLAPPPASDLWRFGCETIGRDAATGEERPGFPVEGFDADGWREVTREPRRYGFHATLKAPFRLSDAAGPDELSAAVAELASGLSPFEVGPLGVSTLATGGGRAFVALTPLAPSAELARLESVAVRFLDRFRAPLTAGERARRNPERLSARQREMLENWGYPYALDEFRLHFTLTGAIADFEPVAAALSRAYAERVASPLLTVDALVLFVQDGLSGHFAILRRFPFGGSTAA
jgi:Protein of unknown function (DUF1045)